MKKVIIGSFASSIEAEKLIQHLYHDLGIDRDNISYVYHDVNGGAHEIGAEHIARDMTAEGATAGAAVGGTAGALAGIATVMGIIPVVGPIFAAGTLITALGIGAAGAVGTAVSGALTGALAGGVIGALVNLGASESEAKEYEDRVRAGNVLVVVHAEDDAEIKGAFASYGASSIHVHTPVV